MVKICSGSGSLLISSSFDLMVCGGGRSVSNCMTKILKNFCKVHEAGTGFKLFPF